MRIRLLLVATYRDLAGTGEVEMDLPAGATAADAVRRLRQSGNGASHLPERPVLAVNQNYASLETALSDGDEIALLPPVAGG
jgi:molybdopterin synthase catalytic subunit